MPSSLPASPLWMNMNFLIRLSRKAWIRTLANTFFGRSVVNVKSDWGARLHCWLPTFKQKCNTVVLLTNRVTVKKQFHLIDASVERNPFTAMNQTVWILQRMYFASSLILSSSSIRMKETQPRGFHNLSQLIAMCYFQCYKPPIGGFGFLRDLCFWGAY